MLFVYIVAVAVALISLVNGVFVAPTVGSSPFEPLLVTVALTALVIAIDGVTAFLVNALPKRCMNHEQAIYQVSRREKNFYEKLKIRRWKDKIPELGGVKNFRKNKIDDPFNNDYVETYLREICYGEWTHFLSLVTGFAVLLFFPAWRWGIGLPVALVNASLNLPSIFILRYNSFKLRVLLKGNARRKLNSKKE